MPERANPEDTEKIKHWRSLMDPYIIHERAVHERIARIQAQAAGGENMYRSDVFWLIAQINFMNEALVGALDIMNMMAGEIQEAEIRLATLLSKSN